MSAVRGTTRRQDRSTDPLDMLDSLPEYRAEATPEQQEAARRLVIRRFGDTEVGRDLLGALGLLGEDETAVTS